MPQSLAQINLHIIFLRRKIDNRFSLIESSVTNYTRIWSGRARISMSRRFGGGFEGHVHVLCRFSLTLTVADFIAELKRESSKWIKPLGTGLGPFQWQAGYGAFSISPSHVEGLQKYIAHQEVHDRREAFQDEFRRLLKRCQVEYDERYVWD